MRRTAPLIVGAGPAGCAAAITLAREGIRPVLLDRDAQARDQLCGGFLSWRTAAQLQALGVAPDSLGARRIETLALFAGGREVTLPLPATAFGLSRRALDQALRQRAVAAGALLVTDQIRTVEGTSAVGRERTWTEDGLFLATGKHDIHGLTRPRRAADPALGLRLRLPSAAARTALLSGHIELHLFDRGYAGIVLQEDGTANVCLAVRKSLLRELGGNPSDLLAHLAGKHEAFAARLASDWGGATIESVGAVPYGWIARAAEPGLFRLGDQSAAIPSLAGEGISIALASGLAAARHWLANGAAGAAAYQREMASRVARPVRIAGLAWTLAERPAFAGPALALAGRLPPVIDVLMRLSRVRPEPMLAQAGDAS